LIRVVQNTFLQTFFYPSKHPASIKKWAFPPSQTLEIVVFNAVGGRAFSLRGGL
jgi:hypothetical protein